MTISGHIGELIPFEVQEVGTVTGVFFGTGETTHEVVNENFLNAKVPDDASWGPVYFYKTNSVETFGIFGTGHQQTGALSALNLEMLYSGFLGYGPYGYPITCSSGSITYSNLFEASGICFLSATGVSQDLASGRLFDAYDSGLCGSDFDDAYTHSGYSASTTRVDNFNTFEDESGNWIAIGEVQDTGNFVSQKASVEVTCSVPQVEQTDYHFVPIPLVSDFSPKEGKADSFVHVLGKCFADVVGVSISGVSLNFEALSNELISGIIPSGVFDNKIVLESPSGVFSESRHSFSSFDGLLTDPTSKTLNLFDMSIQVTKGSTGLSIFLGENISGLTSGYLQDENDEKTDLLSDPAFSYTPATVQISTSGLKEGPYDLIVTSPINSDTVQNAVNVLDGPIITYSLNTTLTSGLIEEPEEYDTNLLLFNSLSDKVYPFYLTGEANQLCLNFNNVNVSAGSATYELKKDYGGSRNRTNIYYTDGSGVTTYDSSVDAWNKYDNGIYTRDEYGDPYGPYSKKLNCNCEVINSGDSQVSDSLSFRNTGVVTGILDGAIDDYPIVVLLKNSCLSDFDTYTGSHSEFICTGGEFSITSGIIGSVFYSSVPLSAAGYSTGENITNILQQLSAYPDYEIVSWTHVSGVAHETHRYASGINYPYSIDLLNNPMSEPWGNILSSGVQELSSDGGGLNNLTSGYSVIDLTPLTIVGQLSASGASEDAAQDEIESIVFNEYSRCTTGNYTTGEVILIETLSRTGVIYGYC